MTLRAERLLRQARCCVYAGSLVSPQLLALLPPDSERHDSAGMTLEEIIEVCRQARERGCDVVRLHSGEPAIYGAIGEQMDALDRLGIEYEVVPGISSFQAAAAALRVELTAPEIAQTIILTRTAGRTPMPPAEELSRLAAVAGHDVHLSLGRQDRRDGGDAGGVLWAGVSGGGGLSRLVAG